MSAGVILFAALTPGLFWLWFFTRGRFYRPRPARLLLLSFVLGAISTLPASILEGVLIADHGYRSREDLASLATAMFFVVGPVEETCKFLAVRFGAARSRYFVETTDGLVYAAAASFGFASAENIGYAVIYGPEVMFARGPISTVAHFAFGALWGVALGARIEGRVGRWVVIGGLIAAAGMHGAFNVFAGSFGGFGTLAAVALMVMGAVVAQRLFARARRDSPFRLRRNVPHAICNCGNTERYARSECSVCGRSLTRPARLVCGNCESLNPGSARYCSRCGDQFVPAPRQRMFRR